MTKCDNCSNPATKVLDVPWGLPQYFCEDCLPRAVRAQFGPEHLKSVALDTPVEAVAEQLDVEIVAEAVAEDPTPAPKKKKGAVAVEEPVVEEEPVVVEELVVDEEEPVVGDTEQAAAHVSDN